MFIFLLVLHAIIAACLVAVILMQKSEGGGLGMGSGSPSGLMSARGAADFLSRSTGVLASLFVILSIVMAVMAATRHDTSIDTSLARHAPAPAANQAPIAPADAVPFGSAAEKAAQSASNAAAPAPAPANDSVPLAQ